MIFKSAIVLISLVYSVQSQYPFNPNQPVRILDLKDIVIEGYHGPMNDKTLGLFENVEILTFQECNFTTLNENFLHPLKNLKKLVVANSHFDRVKEDLSLCCKNLREMELIATNMGTIGDIEFKKAAAMKSLEKLSGNRMNVPVINANNLVGSNLKSLVIEFSNLKVVVDGAFNGMDKLEVLNFRSNLLETIPTKALTALKNLKHLDLSNNLLKKLTTEDFPLMPNLETVNLGHNPVKEFDLRGLKEKLPKLKEVDVSGIDYDPTKNEGLPLIKIQIG